MKNTLGALPYPLDPRFPMSFPAFRPFLPMEGLADDRRSLLEGRSLLYKPMPSDYVTCPFSGSRKDHAKPMNAGALTNLTAEIGTVKSYLSHIAGLVVEETTGEPQQDVVAKLVRTGYTCFKAPQLWLLNRHLGHESDLPSIVATSAKLAQGLIDLSFFASKVGAPPLPTEATGASLYDYVEQHGKLIGAYEVCAGPPNVIRGFLEAVLATEDSASHDLPKLRFMPPSLLDYASLVWHADMTAVLYNYVRVSLLRAQGLDLDLRHHLRVTFPFALNVFAHVNEGRPFDEAPFSTLFKQSWSTVRTREIVDHVLKLAAPLHAAAASSSEDFIFDEARKYTSIASEIFSLLSVEINRLEVLPKGIEDVSTAHLAILFGDIECG